MAIPSFVDQVTLHVYGGDGGHGCASVHREKFKPLGGPDGGNGGDGGSVILRVDPDLTTLVDYHRQSHRRATNGQPGRGDHQNGARGEDVVLRRARTAPWSPMTETGELLADLTGAGAEVVVAQGGRGGLGNAALASSGPQGARLRPAGRGGRDPDHHPRAQGRRRRRAGRVSQRRQVLAGRGHLPRPAEDRRLPVHHPGPQPGRGGGRRRHLHRRRRARADRGGQRGARARVRLPPPHRTLRRAGARDRLRDLPARPRPAHRPRRDRGRADRPRRPGGSAPAGRPEQGRRARTPPSWPSWRPPSCAARGLPVFPISTKTGEGLPALTFAMAELVAARRAAAAAGSRPRIVLRPRAGRPVRPSSPSRGRASSGGSAGTSPSAGSRQTDFGNAEAVGYLADRLNRIGIEDRLLRAGRPGRRRGRHRRSRRGGLRLRPAGRDRRGDPQPPRRGPAVRRGASGRAAAARAGPGVPRRRRGPDE